MAAPGLQACGELERGHGERLISAAERAVRESLEAEARRRGLRDFSGFSTPALRIAVVSLLRLEEQPR